MVTELDSVLELVRQFTFYPFEGEEGEEEEETEQKVPIPQLQLLATESHSLLNQIVHYYSSISDDLSAGYKSLLFSLLQILFIHSNDLQTDYQWSEREEFHLENCSYLQQQEVLKRRRLFCRWLENASRSGIWLFDGEKEKEGEDTVFSRCLDCLYVHDIESACNILKEEGYERLALQLSQISILFIIYLH